MFRNIILISNIIFKTQYNEVFGASAIEKGYKIIKKCLNYDYLIGKTAISLFLFLPCLLY